MGWPTIIDIMSFKKEVYLLKEHCEMLLDNAPASEQFLNMVELLEQGTSDVYTKNPPLSVYSHVL
jgi:hypothetical protein